MSINRRRLRSVVLAFMAAALVVAAAFPWGLETMVASGLGALAAGLAIGLQADEPDQPESPSRVIAATDASVKEIVLDLSSDAETVRELFRLRSTQPAAFIMARIREDGLRQALRSRFDMDGVKPHPFLFSTERYVAESLFTAERFFEQAYWRNQTRVHAVIIGFTRLGRACLDEAIFCGIAGHLLPPRVTIMDARSDRVRSALAFNAPELGQSANVIIQDFDEDAPTRLEAALEAAEAEAPLTCILVCLDDGASRVKVMTWIHVIQSRRDHVLGPVFIVSTEASPMASSSRPVERRRDSTRRFVVFTCPEDFHESPARATSRGDATAERLHDAYRVSFGGQGGSNLPWGDLAETFRLSSRRAARHLSQKLWTAGLTWAGTSPDPGTVDPQAYAMIIEPCSKSPGEDALLRRLARLEHDRWCADRRLDGWVYGRERDTEKRRHPNLVSFDDPNFTDADIAKDIDQIRFLFGAATTPEVGGAAAAIVLGVLARPEEINGIDLEEAWNLVGIDASRPVILLSALLDDTEIEIVERIGSELRESRRQFRVIVPELGRDNDHIAIARERGADGLARLLSWPETDVIPIRYGSALGEGWTDPQTTSSEVDLLISYCSERSNAIIVGATSPIFVKVLDRTPAV